MQESTTATAIWEAQAAAEIEAMTAELRGKLGRVPTTGELIAMNMRRNGKAPAFTAERKRIDDTLLRRQVAEQDARLAELRQDREKERDFFARLYPLTASEQLRDKIKREQQERYGHGSAA